MTEEQQKKAPSAFEFGMVRFNKDPNKLASRAQPAAGSRAQTVDDVLFGGSEATTELETPISGDAEHLSAVTEGWETASQWSQGAEDVIAGAMGEGDRPPAKSLPQAQAKAAVRALEGAAAAAATPVAAVGRAKTAATPAGKPASLTLERKPRRRPTTASYAVAGIVFAAGLGCAAWLAFGIAAWPLAIVTAALGVLGAGFSFALTSR